MQTKRDEVLGWMQRTGNGYVLAAEHFGLSRDTVKAWVRRYVKNAPPRTDPRTFDGVGGSSGNDGTVGNGGEGSGGSAKAPRPPSRATAASFPEQDRARLRGAVRRGLDVLDSEIGWTDPKKAADAARALKELMTMTPDLLTFDERTNGTQPSDSAGNPDALDLGVRAALERARTEAPARRVPRSGEDGPPAVPPDVVS